MDDSGWDGTQGLLMREPLIFERSRKGRRGITPPEKEVSADGLLPEEVLREEIEGFPEVSEVDVIRHFTRLSQWNYGVDTGFYPLGSCTMKYNPKVNEDVARLKGFVSLHPYQPEGTFQGVLKLLFELEALLAEISGMDAVTLQPAAGAHGELTGMLMIRRYFMERGEERRKVLIPDTAHGTNPASSVLTGFEAIEVKSGRDGILHAADIAPFVDDDVAALMLTNPNTLGLFEREIKEIADLIHSKGGFVYCDGANLNALMGIVRMGDLGVDIIQFNLHKTFSTPHGGGGPGSGPVGVKSILEPYLPIPRIVKENGGYRLDFDRPKSIGKVRSFYGNLPALIKAYTYIRRMGRDGLKRASELAVLNANYVKEQLKDHYHLPYDSPCMHECVFTDRVQSRHGVKTLDIAKRLIDYGYHPPTIYFPLVVSGAIMIEPTETESKETLDGFISAMVAIAREAEEEPERLKGAPQRTKTGRCDEVRAARRPVLRWKG